MERKRAEIKMDVEEFKAILKIIPTDDLTAMMICDASEQFMYEYPKLAMKIIREEFRKTVEGQKRRLK